MNIMLVIYVASHLRLLLFLFSVLDTFGFTQKLGGEA
jgi:hypothetical protein